MESSASPQNIEGGPFEPIDKTDLKCLTFKTVFLLTIASGRRRSEIHALLGTEDSIRCGLKASSVFLQFFAGFLAKTRNPRRRRVAF